MKDSRLRFWQWFASHQDQLFDFEMDQERIFDELARELRRVHPGLTFEFGPKANPREFVISADGIREVFPAVPSLVAAAPKLERWKITAFRPRHTPLCRVQIGETFVDPADVEFSLLTKNSNIGIQLFMPGFKKNDMTRTQIAYLLLDNALGEYDVETKLGLIQILAPSSPSSAKRYSLPELPSLFDQLVSSLSGQSLSHGRCDDVGNRAQ